MRWQETNTEEGISIPWLNITLHAISNEPVKCIYIMLDAHVDFPRNRGNGFNGNQNGNGHIRNENDIDEDEADEGTCEGMFV